MSSLTWQRRHASVAVWIPLDVFLVLDHRLSVLIADFHQIQTCVGTKSGSHTEARLKGRQLTAKVRRVFKGPFVVEPLRVFVCTRT